MTAISLLILLIALSFIATEQSELFSSDEDLEGEEEADEQDSDYSAFFGSKSKNKEKRNKGPKVWDRWGKWSDCSATCGLGKMTRWRHCVSGSCERGEKEAQIKTCTKPAC